MTETTAPMIAHVDALMTASCTTEAFRDAFENVPEATRMMLAHVWKEAYRQGVDDERTATELCVGIGVGGIATANRMNPFEYVPVTPLHPAAWHPEP